MSTEVELGYAWIESTLSNDATLTGPTGYAPGGVVQTFPLPGITAPYIVVRHQSSQDHPVFGGGNSHSELRFRAEVAGPTNTLSALKSAAARINTLLTVTAQTVTTDGTILGSYRDQQLASDEYVDGAKWHVTGGEYKIFAKGN